MFSYQVLLCLALCFSLGILDTSAYKFGKRSGSTHKDSRAVYTPRQVTRRQILARQETDRILLEFRERQKKRGPLRPRASADVYPTYQPDPTYKPARSYAVYPSWNSGQNDLVDYNSTPSGPNVGANSEQECVDKCDAWSSNHPNPDPSTSTTCTGFVYGGGNCFLKGSAPEEYAGNTSPQQGAETMYLGSCAYWASTGYLPAEMSADCQDFYA